MASGGGYQIDLSQVRRLRPESLPGPRTLKRRAHRAGKGLALDPLVWGRLVLAILNAMCGLRVASVHVRGFCAGHPRARRLSLTVGEGG